MTTLNKIEARLTETAAGFLKKKKSPLSDAAYEKLDKKIDAAVKAYNAKAAAHIAALLPKIKAAGLDLNAAKTSLNMWRLECEDDLRMGMEEAGEGGNFKGGGGGSTTAAEAFAEFKTGATVEEMQNQQTDSANQKSIQGVKDAGKKLAANPNNKVKILQKLGLTGAEFHALCLMIKEQL